MKRAQIVNSQEYGCDAEQVKINFPVRQVGYSDALSMAPTINTFPLYSIYAPLEAIYSVRVPDNQVNAKKGIEKRVSASVICELDKCLFTSGTADINSNSISGNA